MLWQDWVISIGQSILAIALIPSLLNKKDKPALTTSAISAFVLYIFAVVFYTLELIFASVVVALTAFFWTILAIQKIRTKG